jgi:hypothetical protein
VSKPLELKACYSVGELARAMGLLRFQTYRVLKARSIPEGPDRGQRSHMAQRASEAGSGSVGVARAGASA